MKHATTATLVMMASVTVANAQLSYTQNDITRAGYITRAIFSGSPTYNPGSSNWAENLGGLFQDQLQSFSYSSPIDASDYPQISNVVQDYTVRTQASSNRFEYSWDAVSILETSGDILRPDVYVAALSAQADVTVHVETDSQLRISWVGSAGQYLTTDNVFGLTSQLAINVTTQNGTFNGFSAGFGTGTSTITQPFSFTVDALAGEAIRLDFDMAFLLQTRDESLSRNGWDQFQNSSFVIEVVPAPSACALFGAAGLFASRRRRG